MFDEETLTKAATTAGQAAANAAKTVSQAFVGLRKPVRRYPVPRQEQVRRFLSTPVESMEYLRQKHGDASVQRWFAAMLRLMNEGY